LFFLILEDSKEICEGGSTVISCNDPNYPLCCRYEGEWWCCKDDKYCCYEKAADALIALAKPTNPKQAVVEPKPEVTQGNYEVYLMLVFCV
jgi:hypothetical protein